MVEDRFQSIISKKSLCYLLAIICSGRIGLSYAESAFPISPCAEVEAAALEASKLRKLPIRKAVACIAVGREEFQKLVQEELEKDNPPARMRLEGIAYKMLGIIPQDYNYQDCLASDYANDVMAFYHLGRHAIICPNWIATPRSVLIHEAVHALQDQHFDLEKLRKIANKTTDSALALAALAEGDAVLVQDEHNQIIGSHDIEAPVEPIRIATKDGCGLPDLLRKQFEFPYDYGKFFVEHLRARGGFEQLNAIFREPPRRSREVLYPREYLAKEFNLSRAQTTTILSPLFRKKPTREIYRDSLGEYSIRSLLRSLVNPEDGVRAAKGLKSDLVTLYESLTDGRKTLVWETIWESEKEAKQFREAYIKALQKIHQTTLMTQSDRILFSSQHYPSIMIARHKNRVRYEVSEIPQGEL